MHLFSLYLARVISEEVNIADPTVEINLNINLNVDDNENIDVAQDDTFSGSLYFSVKCRIEY